MIGLADLRGRWRLSREIADARAGLTGRFEGTCTFTPDAEGLRQVEEGVLHFGAAPPMRAGRVYLWRAQPEGLEVLFEDGRPFHQLSPDLLSDRHLCDPDTYDVTYDLSRWPDWTQAWRVTGPRKDARITSRFQPLG